MEKNLHEWPEIIFGSANTRESQAIRRAVKAGELRKLAARIYTSDLKSKPASIIARNSYHILGKLFPGAVVSHRSALEGGISKTGSIVLTYKYTKIIKLPGLTVRLYRGKGAQMGDSLFMGQLYIASRERALLENLQQSRGLDSVKKSLPKKAIEELLDKFCRVYGEEKLNKLREQARALAKSLNLEKEFYRLEQLIGSLLGSKSAYFLQSPAGVARAKGKPYDVPRLELFAKLAAYLAKEILPIRNETIHSSTHLNNLAFFESYFSNYIEGTEFTVEEALAIIFHHRIIPNRTNDAHDITATFQIVANTSGMSKTPQSASELIELLKKRHYTLMSVRTDKNPGVFKDIVNRAGNTIFVNPELVEGTLLKAFSLYETLDEGIARAFFIMFVVAEVHPFVDGNGRLARIMMNAELVHARQSRIIIPTVYREDYILALRRLSRSGDPKPYIDMLAYAQAFTSSINFTDYAHACTQLKKCHAFAEPHAGKLIIKGK